MLDDTWPDKQCCCTQRLRHLGKIGINLCALQVALKSDISLFLYHELQNMQTEVVYLPEFDSVHVHKTGAESALKNAALDHIVRYRSFKARHVLIGQM